MVTVRPGIFHVHVDAFEPLSGGFRRALESHSTARQTDFVGHPEGYHHFEPTEHFTFKLPSREQFNDTWVYLVEAASEASDFVGYLEGEYISTDEMIPFRPYNPAVACPFQIQRRRLKPERGEEFRHSELHLVMDKDASDPRLIQSLLEAGLFGAYLPKQDHTAIVLTAQGFSQSINRLFSMVENFINFA